ncbi:MAG: hypothetical protein JOY71_00355 [Acetobacteraceae bacterium]|nr:hypothetical protein [Acetobacteraceae bacterium]
MLRSLAWCLGLGVTAATITVGTAAGSPFAAALVGSVVGGAAGNFGHEVCKVLDRRVLGKLLEGRSGIAENHVVVQALRLAELKALGTILERFDYAQPRDRPREGSEAARVSAELAKFIAEQTKAAKSLAFAAPGDDTPVERALRQEVLNTLPQAFDQGLAARRAAGDEAAIAESLAQIRRTVETAVLAEVRLTLFAPGEEFPRGFTELFVGTDTTPGWFDLFLRDAANRIKAASAEDDSAFEKVWNAEQVAMIKAIAEAHTAILERLDSRTERIELKLSRHVEVQRLSMMREKLVELRKHLYELGVQYDDLGPLSAGMKGARIVGKIIASYEAYKTLFPDDVRIEIDGLLSGMRDYTDQSDDQKVGDALLDLFTSVQTIWQATSRAISIYSKAIDEHLKA